MVCFSGCYNFTFFCDVNIDNELLILLVQERPVLWDKTLDIFKDRNATRTCPYTLDICQETLPTLVENIYSVPHIVCF